MFQNEPNNYFFTFKNKNSLKMSKKGDFENPKVINCDCSTIFSIVRFPGGAKTVLSGDPRYIPKLSKSIRSVAQECVKIMIKIIVDVQTCQPLIYLSNFVYIIYPTLNKTVYIPLIKYGIPKI